MSHEPGEPLEPLPASRSLAIGCLLPVLPTLWNSSRSSTIGKHMLEPSRARVELRNSLARESEHRLPAETRAPQHCLNTEPQTQSTNGQNPAWYFHCDQLQGVAGGKSNDSNSTQRWLDPTRKPRSQSCTQLMSSRLPPDQWQYTTTSQQSTKHARKQQASHQQRAT